MLHQKARRPQNPFTQMGKPLLFPFRAYFTLGNSVSQNILILTQTQSGDVGPKEMPMPHNRAPPTMTDVVGNSPERRPEFSMDYLRRSHFVAESYTRFS